MAITKTEAEQFKIPSGWKLVAWSQYSNIPADDYLAIVLCRSVDGKEWVTWCYNKQSKGCAHGHYHRTENAASTEFAKRPRIHDLAS